ncbi:MAG: hypothetical protein ACE5M4_06435 [Anaerolineales bacterium]
MRYASHRPDAATNALRRLRHKQNWRAVLLLALVVFVFSGPIHFRRIAYPTDNDYSLHVLYAQQIAEGKYGDVPLNALAHPAMQVILIAMHLISLRNLGFYASLIVVQTAAQVATALILYFWFGSKGQRQWNWIRGFWAATLTIVSPIMALAIVDGLYYFGYIGLANYHNPTVHLLRPVALLSLVLALRIFSHPRNSGRYVAVSALLVIVSGAIKPNFAMVILPALGVLALWRAYRRKSVDWRLLILGFFVPGVLVLSSQWMVAFWLARGEQVSILFRPLEVETAFSSYLAPKFFLSIVFPLTVLVAFFGRPSGDRSTQLGWLAFLFGAAQMYLLAEGGDRFFHGNFRWGGQIGLFLLFAAMGREVARISIEEARSRKFRLAATYGVYLTHAFAGLAYFIRSFVSRGYG